MELILQSQTTILILAGVLSFLATTISFRLIYQHSQHHHSPEIRTYLIRILLIVPIYAIGGWLGLRWPEQNTLWAVGREFYEGFALYSFFCFLKSFIGDDDEVILRLKNNSYKQENHKWPFCCLPSCCDWKVGKPFLQMTRFGVLQFAMVNPILQLAALFCWWLENEAGNKLAQHESASYLAIFPHLTYGGSIFITFLKGISQLWALYCLILFYFSLKEALRPVSPFGKFLSVKCIIFFNFWQSIAIGILSSEDILNKQIPELENFPKETFAVSVQNFLICFEMLLLALLHTCVFSVSGWNATVDALAGESKPLLQERYARLYGYQSDFITTTASVLDISDINREYKEQKKGFKTTNAGRCMDCLGWLPSSFCACIGSFCCAFGTIIAFMGAAISDCCQCISEWCGCENNVSYEV